tara:strand:+ start:877 stop:1800 length:924 start_codon:yes stop_codon:yes gene_type:complete
MSYSFLKESKLFIVYGGNKYRIHTTTALSFSQTFASDSYTVKTLHNQSKMSEASTITQANPAQFSFDVPLTIEKDESIVMDLLSDLVATSDSDIETQQLKSFDMYIQTTNSTFKVASCVITGGAFNFSLKEAFIVSLEGEGTKLTRAGNESYSIPGELQSETSTRTPLQVFPVLTIDSLDMNNLISANLQIQNDITWTPFETLQESLAVTNSSNAMFPSSYTVDNRIVSGTVTQYQTDNNITQFDDFSTNSNITLKAKKMNGDIFWQIQMNPSMYSARVNVGEVFTQTYDFTSQDNTALATQISTYS